MNENETVEQVYAVIERVKDAYSLDAGSKVYNSAVAALLHNINDWYLAAHKSELAAKDTLIKELADALEKIDNACDGDMCKHFVANEHCSKCVYIETCQTGIAHNALKTNESEITKARE